MSKHPAFELAREVSEGNVPSNAVLEKTIDSTKQALETEAKQRGQGAPETKIAKDSAQLLETTKQFIKEKNEGEVIQKFFLDAKEAAAELSDQLQKLAKEGKITYPGYGIGDLKEQAKAKAQDWAQIAQESINTMKGFSITLVDSPEFRSLLMEFISLVQETVRMEAQKAPSMDLSGAFNQPLSQELQQKGIETMEFGKTVVQDIKQGAVPISEDRKQLLAYKFQNVLRRLSANPEFKRAVNGLFLVFDQINYYSQQFAAQAQQQLQGAKPEDITKRAPHLWKMWEDGKTFLAGFTGEELLNKAFQDFKSAYELFMSDERITRYFYEIRSFIYDVLQNPELLDKEDFAKRFNDLWEQAQQWTYDPKYNRKYNQIWDDIDTIGQSIKSDPLQSRLAKDAATLAQDLILDETGQPSLKIMTTGLNQFRALVAPILIKNMEELSIPSFSGSNDTYDWTIKNMILNGREIIPDNIDIKVWGAANLSLASTSAKALTFVTVWVRDIGVDIKDLQFHFIRKSWPQMDETGVADINITGKGSTLKLVWRIEGSQDQPWLFNLYDVQCNLRDLNITVKQSTHTWLMKMITSLWSGTIKRQIEYRIENTLRGSLLPINDRLTEVLRG